MHKRGEEASAFRAQWLGWFVTEAYSSNSESKCLQEGSETCCSVIYGWETVTLFNKQEDELEVAEFHLEWPGWTELEMSIEQEELMFCIFKAKFERIEE